MQRTACSDKLLPRAALRGEMEAVGPSAAASDPRPIAVVMRAALPVQRIDSPDL